MRAMSDFEIPEKVDLDMLKTIVRLGCVIGIRVDLDGAVHLHPVGYTYLKGQYVCDITPSERIEFLDWCVALYRQRQSGYHPKAYPTNSELWEQLRVDLQHAYED